METGPALERSWGEASLNLFVPASLQRPDTSICAILPSYIRVAGVGGGKPLPEKGSTCSTTPEPRAWNSTANCLSTWSRLIQQRGATSELALPSPHGKVEAS